MINAIAFDGNGVLYFRDRDFAQSLMEYIRRLYLPAFDIVSGRAAFENYMRQSFDGSMGKSEAIDLFLDAAGIFEPAVRADLVERELAFSRRIDLFPMERETLLELSRRGFKLGMITNSFQSAEEKASWFRELGLDCIADTVISSIDTGYSKPDRGIYLAFARRIGEDPSTIAFVGHEGFELEGARNAGMLPVSFNCDPGIREKIHLDIFSDLLDIFPAPGSAPVFRKGQT